MHAAYSDSPLTIELSERIRQHRATRGQSRAFIAAGTLVYRDIKSSQYSLRGSEAPSKSDVVSDLVEAAWRS
jgi:hypothetical protein